MNLFEKTNPYLVAGLFFGLVAIAGWIFWIIYPDSILSKQIFPFSSPLAVLVSLILLRKANIAKSK